ncbi:MAG: hypothetical protein GXY25_06550 [Pirellulaceae bacterium]|jgi:hypothetical protein|nr:hypothetical protein [Thermoguttaceae bacterium]NLZ00180.1 hypothetical protein [Pirellulaceae bacterium]
MRWFSCDQWIHSARSLSWPVVILWLGIGAVTIALLILSRTRWGQTRLLRKCLVLSILAHVLLAGYATTVKIVSGLPPRAPAPIVHIALDDGDPWDARSPEAGVERPRPWASHHHPSSIAPAPLDLDRADAPDDGPRERPARAPSPGLSTSIPLDDLAVAGPLQPDPDAPSALPAAGQAAPHRSAEPIDPPKPQRRAARSDPAPPLSTERIEPDRRASGAESGRAEAEGLPASLVEQSIPLPRLEDQPVVVEPSSILAGPIDAPTTAPRGSPADLARARAENSARPGRLAPSALASATGPVQPSPPIAAAATHGLVEVPPGDAADAVGPPLLGNPRQRRPVERIPKAYQLRVAPNRSEIALRHGATSETEEAVHAALRWLADNQERDGRWRPARHGGGQEPMVHGRDRFSAGSRADTGISALALLAFMAAGHTHQDGLYRDNVRRGLESLLLSQAADGNLGGKASTYAFMYCHAMATIALSEAFGMSGDARLEGPVRRAVMFTITAQNPSTGGWRYTPGDEGDTSQLGWQLMALKSAELAGIPMPEHTRQAAIRFLDSVSSGRHGGLAAYRPVEPPSRPMTAEALACRHFLGIPADSLAAREAAEYLLGELPGEGQANLYYWYYATLGLNQVRGDAWERWNAALQRELLASQRSSGPLAGSWDHNTVWGGYGGRVYSTALAALCLEVYYRFMPLYVEAAAIGRQLR